MEKIEKYKKIFRVLCGAVVLFLAIVNMIFGHSGTWIYLLVQLFLFYLLWCEEDRADLYQNLFYQLRSEAEVLVKSIVKSIKELEEVEKELKKFEKEFEKKGNENKKTK